MHLIFVAEQPEGIVPRFEKWLRERIFKTESGKGHSVRLREFKFYELTYPKEIHEQVVGTLKTIEHGGRIKLDRVRKLLKFLKKFIPEGVELIDTSKFKKIPIKDELLNHGVSTKLMMIATLEDDVVKGREML